MLFVVIDPSEGRIVTAWLVPSPDFADRVTKPNGRGRRVFKASNKRDTADQWRDYRLTAAELPLKVLDRLAELDMATRR